MKILINRQPPSVLKLANALIAAEGTASDRTLKPHDVYAFFGAINAKLDFIEKNDLKGTQISFFGCFPIDAFLSPARYTSEATCFKALHNGRCWVIYEIFRAPGNQPNVEIELSHSALRALEKHFTSFNCR